MLKIKNLFQRLFGKRVRAEEEIDYPIYPTEIPGLIIYRGTRILTSPMKFAPRRAA